MATLRRRMFGAAEGRDSPVVLDGPDETGVFFLLMQALPDNRLNPALVAAINAALDVVEQCAAAAPGTNCALVTASGCAPRFFSNGLDLEYLFSSRDEWFICDGCLALLKRVLLLPFTTVAEISGHAFAGGLLLALSHDYRVMVDNGRAMLSLNEILLPSPLHPGMAALARARLPPATLHALVMSAKRYRAQEALSAGLVDHIADTASLRAKSHQLAKAAAPLAARAGSIVGALRAGLYPDVVRSLELRMPIDVAKFMRSAAPKHKEDSAMKNNNRNDSTSSGRGGSRAAGNSNL